MGLFTSPQQRLPYVPPLGRDDGGPAAGPSPPATMLGSAPPADNDWLSRLAPPPPGSREPDPNIVLASNPDPGPPADDVQIAQQQLATPRRGVAPSTELPPGTQLKDGPGQPVILPDGSRVPDPSSPSGHLMSPVGDLNNVASAGREAGDTYRRLLTRPGGGGGFALVNLGLTMRRYIAQGGAFDYQRERNDADPTRFTQLRQFRNVSNVNVGLFAQQAGISLHDVLTMAGQYAGKNSSNARPDQPYGLDRQTKEFIEIGYRIGQSGAFNRRATP